MCLFVAALIIVILVVIILIFSLWLIFINSHSDIFIINCKWHNSPSIGIRVFHNLQAYHCNRDNQDQVTILQILILSHIRLIALMLHQFYDLFYFISLLLLAFILNLWDSTAFRGIFFVPAAFGHLLILSTLHHSALVLIFWTIYTFIYSVGFFFLCILLSSHWI